MSPWLDLKILIATVVTLGGRTSVPLSWLLPRSRFYDRRDRRASGGPERRRDAPRSESQPDTGKAVTDLAGHSS